MLIRFFITFRGLKERFVFETLLARFSECRSAFFQRPFIFLETVLGYFLKYDLVPFFRDAVSALLSFQRDASNIVRAFADDGRGVKWT